MWIVGKLNIQAFRSHIGINLFNLVINKELLVIVWLDTQGWMSIICTHTARQTIKCIRKSRFESAVVSSSNSTEPNIDYC